MATPSLSWFKKRVAALNKASGYARYSAKAEYYAAIKNNGNTRFTRSYANADPRSAAGQARIQRAAVSDLERVWRPLARANLNVARVLDHAGQPGYFVDKVGYHEKYVGVYRVGEINGQQVVFEVTDFGQERILQSGLPAGAVPLTVQVANVILQDQAEKIHERRDKNNSPFGYQNE